MEKCWQFITDEVNGMVNLETTSGGSSWGHRGLCLGLKQVVNLLSGYPDASICGYPNIIKLVLLAIYFIFISTSSAKYSSLSILIST